MLFAAVIKCPSVGHLIAAYEHAVRIGRRHGRALDYLLCAHSKNVHFTCTHELNNGVVYAVKFELPNNLAHCYQLAKEPLPGDGQSSD